MRLYTYIAYSGVRLTQRRQIILFLWDADYDILRKGDTPEGQKPENRGRKSETGFVNLGEVEFSAVSGFWFPA